MPPPIFCAGGRPPLLPLCPGGTEGGPASGQSQDMRHLCGGRRALLCCPRHVYYLLPVRHRHRHRPGGDRRTGEGGCPAGPVPKAHPRPHGGLRPGGGKQPVSHRRVASGHGSDHRKGQATQMPAKNQPPCSRRAADFSREIPLYSSLASTSRASSSRSRSTPG